MLYKSLRVRLFLKRMRYFTRWHGRVGVAQYSQLEDVSSFSLVTVVPSSPSRAHQ